MTIPEKSLNPGHVSAVGILSLCALVTVAAYYFIWYMLRCLKEYRSQDNAIRAELLEIVMKDLPPEHEGAYLYIIYVAWLHVRGKGRTLEEAFENLRVQAKHKLAKTKAIDLIAYQTVISKALPVRILITMHPNENTTTTY